MVPQYRIHHGDGIADPWEQTYSRGGGSDEEMWYAISGDSPYGPNTFANGWIEAEILNETWWFEIPHGFLRDPTASPCAPEPQTVQLAALPWMASMKPHHLVPWRAVTLEQRQLKDGTTVSLRIAEPHHGSLMRIGLESAWRDGHHATKFALHERLSTATVAIPGYPQITGSPLASLLSSDGTWRAETFACASASYGMDFAAISMAIDDEHLDWSVPCGVLVGSDHLVKWPVDPEAGKETEFVSDEPGADTEW